MKLHKLSPILWTKDLKATIAFYENVLGFKGVSNFPNFVSLTRETAEIMFIVPQDEPEECKDPATKEELFPKPQLTGSLFFTMTGVGKYWESVRDKATVKTALLTGSIGCVTFPFSTTTVMNWCSVRISAIKCFPAVTI